MFSLNSKFSTSILEPHAKTTFNFQYCTWMVYMAIIVSCAREWVILRKIEWFFGELCASHWFHETRRQRANSISYRRWTLIYAVESPQIVCIFAFLFVFYFVVCLRWSCELKCRIKILWFMTVSEWLFVRVSEPLCLLLNVCMRVCARLCDRKFSVHNTYDIV